jgi:hypothetical protein
MGLSGAFSSYLGLSGNSLGPLSYFLGLSEIFWGLFKPLWALSEVLWGFLETFWNSPGALWGSLGLSGLTVSGSLRFSGTRWGVPGFSVAFWGLSEALWDSLELAGSVLGLSGTLWGDSGAFCGSLGAIWGKHDPYKQEAAIAVNMHQICSSTQCVIKSRGRHHQQYASNQLFHAMQNETKKPPSP